MRVVRRSRLTASRWSRSLPAAGGGNPVETPERILMRSTLDADLQAALDDLPDAFRQAVWLRDVEEFTYAEIAEMLNVPMGTVMSRISRGADECCSRSCRCRRRRQRWCAAEAAGGRR